MPASTNAAPRAALELTEEAKRYLADGLPELQLVRLLEKTGDALPLAVAKRELPSFPVAIQWAKKLQWVAIEGDRLVLKQRVRDDPRSESLAAAARGQADAHTAELLQRGLVRERKGPSLHDLAIKQLDGNELTPELLQTGLWQQLRLRPYNPATPGRVIHPGKRHPYQAFLATVRERLLGMGFCELTGPTVETQFWNFDALFQPQSHPARDWTDVYSLREPTTGSLPDPALVARVQRAHERGTAGSSGWRSAWSPEKAALLLPRAHDTAISPRALASGRLQVPGKYFQLVRCYRPDVIDATHGVEFNQLGGFVLGRDLTFRHLLGLLKTFVYEVTGLHGAQVRFLTDYYPFVEPGVQISIKHPTKGWMELAGAGLFREELTAPLGIDVPVIAWGFGVDRLAMLALGITDIRQLFAPDLAWLRERPVQAIGAAHGGSHA